MNWANVLRGLLGRPSRPPRPPCRLTEAQALDIARTALGDATPLRIVDVARADGRVEWRIGTATVGSGRTVRIDDENGAVLDTARWGVR